MTETPDWIANTPSTEAIHTKPASSGGEFTTPFPPFKLFGFVTQLIEGILKQVVMAILGVFTPGLSAFAQLTNWAVVLLPDQIMQPISDLINLLITILDLIPIFGPPSGDALEYLANIFGLLRDNTDTAQVTGEVAQTTAESALALASATAAQVAAGTNMSYSDGFGRTIDPTAGTDLGADYSRDADSGVGTWATSGSGNATATISGASMREFRDRNTAAVFVTDKQAGSCVISSPPSAAGGFGTFSCRIGISLRENAAGTTKVSAYYDAGSMYIGYWLAGAYTQLGSMAITQTAGDLFEFHAGCDPGTGYDAYSFECIVGTQKLSVTDSGHASSLGVGSGFKYGELIARLGNVVTGFFFTIQTAAPDVQIFNLFDRT